MSSRRELFLEEMGLTPLWRLKTSAAGGAAAGAQSANAAAVPADTAAAAAPHAAIDTHDRAARIARMDWSELKATVATCTDCGLRKT